MHALLTTPRHHTVPFYHTTGSTRARRSRRRRQRPAPQPIITHAQLRAAVELLLLVVSELGDEGPGAAPAPGAVPGGEAGTGGGGGGAPRRAVRWMEEAAQRLLMAEPFVDYGG